MVLAAGAFDGHGSADSSLAATLAYSMMSRCRERAVNSRSGAACMASSINESASWWAWLETLAAWSMACSIGLARASRSWERSSRFSCFRVSFSWERRNLGRESL
jgi:hypothetical protein